MSKWCRDFVKTLFIRQCAKFLPIRFSVIIVTSEVLNVILLMVNNFDIKQNMAIFVLLYTQASSKIKVGECLQGSVNFSNKRTVFLRKIQLQHINFLSCFLKLGSHWDHPLSMVKCLLLFTSFCRDEISSPDELISIKKTGMKFHSGIKN